MVDILAKVPEQQNNSPSPRSPISSHHVPMATQIDTWNGPGLSIPTSTFLGSRFSPSLRINPIVSGVAVVAKLVDFGILPLKILLFVFDSLKHFTNTQLLRVLIRMRKEINICSPLVRRMI
jgi:hypothetical protein